MCGEAKQAALRHELVFYTLCPGKRKGVKNFFLPQVQVHAKMTRRGFLREHDECAFNPPHEYSCGGYDR